MGEEFIRVFTWPFDEMILPEEEEQTPPPAPTPSDLGRLTNEEAQTEASKRLARVGRYFTSPLGDLTSANTASQKVFS